ncbi:MAG: putative YggU family [Pseudomonadota bacterium]|jgi:uncharacterized protein (TIGR00251 family)
MCYQKSEHGLILELYIQANARVLHFSEIYEGKLKLKVNLPPVDGKANSAIIKFISQNLKVGKSSIEIIQGTKSRHKRVLIYGDFIQLEQSIKQILLKLSKN